MPAVNPTRLKLQIADLLESFHSPEIFHKKLRDFFSFYANRTLRQGEVPDMAPLMHMYHLPDPVMPQLKLDLKQIISHEPKPALEIADLLWQDEYYEIRQIAVYILGQTAVTEPDSIISRLETWLSPDLEPALKKAVLFSGTHRLQSKFPQEWEAWIESLLNRDSSPWVSMGLMALRAGLRTTPSQKMPAIFRILSPFIRDPQPRIVNEMTRLIEDLAKQSPTETAYYLKQSLSISESPETRRLIRQCLPFFPQEARQDLQRALKKQ